MALLIIERGTAYSKAVNQVKFSLSGGLCHINMNKPAIAKAEITKETSATKKLFVINPIFSFFNFKSSAASRT